MCNDLQEVFQGKVLLNLLEESLYEPTFAIDFNDLPLV